MRDLEIFYTQLGELSPAKDNVVWVLHTLTSNAEPSSWWPDLIGPGKPIDSRRHCIICANTLGACYGSTGAASTNPETGEAYGMTFPLITVRDMARAHGLLRRALGIESILLGIGGSVGGQQLLEWAVEEPGLFRQICVVAANAKHSAWGIAFNETQRMALAADPTLHANVENAGARGLEAARAIALLSYRNYDKYAETQADETPLMEGFRAATYQIYQGAKLAKRFDARSYWALTKAMDSHDMGRGRGPIEQVLASIRARALVVGFTSDILFPWREQQYIAERLPDARARLIPSTFGHDATLAEGAAIARELRDFLETAKGKGGPEAAAGAHPRARGDVAEISGS